MYLVFFSNRLNHHQAPVADALYDLTNGDYRFVETTPPNRQSQKGSSQDFSSRPYLIQAWRNNENLLFAKKLATESDVAVFGAESLDFEVLRMEHSGKLAFEMSERWLKRGWINLLSPRLIKYQWYYHTCFYDKPLYKLCSGAYSANDQYWMHSFVNKCYKWGYFTSVSDNVSKDFGKLQVPETMRLMWCARFLKLKHPEMVVSLAKRLKRKGYRFIIDMYGDGPMLGKTKKLANKNRVDDVMFFHGSVANESVLKAMRNHDIFMFTSDRHEGWGAVANEAMSNGCILVASDRIGSTPYLISHRDNGCVFHDRNVKSLEKEVEWLINNPDEMVRIRENSISNFYRYWTPQNAATSLLKLISNLSSGEDKNIAFGPCSKAEPSFLYRK